MGSVITIALFVLAALVAVANLSGCARALWRQRHGDDRGYSCAHLLSLLLSLAAWLVGPEPLGPWVFAPAAIDPANWTLALLPWHAMRDRDSPPE
jgi:hypothetical protein